MENAVVSVSFKSAGYGVFQDNPVVVGAVEIVSQQDSFIKERLVRAVIEFGLPGFLRSFGLMDRVGVVTHRPRCCL